MSLKIPGQFYGSAFKVALIDQWMVILNGPKLLNELGYLPDDELSFTEAIEDVRLRAVPLAHSLLHIASLLRSFYK